MDVAKLLIYVKLTVEICGIANRVESACLNAVKEVQQAKLFRQNAVFSNHGVHIADLWGGHLCRWSCSGSSFCSCACSSSWKCRERARLSICKTKRKDADGDFHPGPQ